MSLGRPSAEEDLFRSIRPARPARAERRGIWFEPRTGVVPSEPPPLLKWAEVRYP